MRFKEFFYFIKSDRYVLLLSLVVICIILLIIYVFGHGYSAPQFAGGDSLNVQNSPISSINYEQNKHAFYNVKGKEAELFPFDPNTADSTQLLRLGLQEWQVRNIYKYRAAGGVYRKAQDFARLFGLTRKQYLAMEPYIHISDDYKPAADLFKNVDEMGENSKDTLKYTPKLKPTEHVLVNTADTSLLKRIPGIGSYFARQIVNYRTRLGGFYSVKQLLEIEGFPEEAIKYMIVSTGELKKMNVNKLTLSQLRRHPYMSFYRARAILDYRRLKGNLHSLSDLRLLEDFSPSDIERLSPYIEF